MTPTQASANRILIWMCVLIAVNQLGFGAVVPVIALYARSFGVTQSAIGLAIAIYGLARFLVALPAGQLGDRLGRRTALAAGGLVTAAGNLLCAYAPSYGAFVGARFVAGAGAALVVTSGQIVLADITTPARRGRVMAIYQGVFLFAVGIGPWPGGLLAERFGLQAPFVVYAVTGVVVSALAWLLVPDTRSFWTRGRRAGGRPAAAALRGTDPRPHGAARLRPREPRRLRQRGGADGGDVQRDPHPRARPPRPQHRPHRARPGAGERGRPGAGVSGRHARRPLWPEDGDRPGDGDGGRLPRPLRRRPVLRAGFSSAASRGARPRV